MVQGEARRARGGALQPAWLAAAVRKVCRTSHSPASVASLPGAAPVALGADADPGAAHGPGTGVEGIQTAERGHCRTGGRLTQDVLCRKPAFVASRGA